MLVSNKEIFHKIKTLYYPTGAQIYNW